LKTKHPRIAVIGLGYVGLPLAIEFGRQYNTIGFDLSAQKIGNYNNGFDTMGEVDNEQFRKAEHISFTSDPSQLKTADIQIVAVPTPVKEANIPDFSPLEGASRTVGQNLKSGAIVVFESTVFPGATEEICIPIIEAESGLKWKKDFSVGYSPERVNPGDKERTLTKIMKVVSGDSEDTLNYLADLYGSIIEAGIHRASSIKVAEASKVIENTQRDLNIALMNELAIVFDKVGIDTLEVLQAAGSKWNFLPFRPGLVGGHCIGVDPYYLTYKAELLGYHPQVILAGRRINDGIPSYVAKMTVQNMVRQGGCKEGDRVLVMGLTFKEDCPDLRNSKVADLVRNLEGYGLVVDVFDPIADADEAFAEYGIKLISEHSELATDYKAMVVAVAHEVFKTMPIEDLLAPMQDKGVFTDVKAMFDPAPITNAGHAVWRL